MFWLKYIYSKALFWKYYFKSKCSVFWTCIVFSCLCLILFPHDLYYPSYMTQCVCFFSSATSLICSILLCLLIISKAKWGTFPFLLWFKVHIYASVFWNLIFNMVSHCFFSNVDNLALCSLFFSSQVSSYSVPLNVWYGR